MSQTQHIPSAKEVLHEFKQKKAAARRLLIARVIKGFILIVCLLVLSVVTFLIDQSDLLRIQNIIISNNHLAQTQRIRDNLPFKEDDRIWLHLPQWTTLSIQDDAIKSLNFVLNGRNVIVWVEEFKPLARTNTHILLSNGTFYPLSSRLDMELAFLPKLEGFETRELSVKLADALLSVEDFVLNLMANIAQNPLSFDNAMVEITLNNGLRIHSDLRSLFLLNQLPLFIDLINENNNCLFLDSVTSTARAAPCP